MRLAQVFAMMGRMSAGAWLVLAASSTWAATFTQNPGIWQDAPPPRDVLTPLLVADSVDSVPPVVVPAAKPKPAARPSAPAKASVLAPAQAAPTGAEIVGKSLSQGPSDPDVPLPHPNLSEMSAESATASRTRLFGRAEPGDGILDFRGGLFGLTVPIPADRGAPGGNTRYSPGLPTLEMGSGARK
ncbi:MAG: hypothetical protein ACT4O6_22180 [Reyranella sp.]